MIIINKKRIQIVTSCVVIGLLAFSFKIANVQTTENNQTENNTTIQTASTPVSGKTIVVDAGHRRA